MRSLGFLFFFILSACSHSQESAPSTAGVTPIIVQGTWSPDALSVTCEGDACPPQLGLLVFVKPAQHGLFEVKNCTAFVTGTREVRSAGHCDFSANQTGYFIRVNRPEGEAIPQIVRSSNKKYKKGPFGKIASGFSDESAYELDSDLEVKPLELADAADPVSQTLDIYKFNAVDKTGHKFVLDHQQCHRKQTKEFPFALDDQVDVLFAYDCSTIEGNSGSPLISTITGRVEASLIGALDIKRKTDVTASNLRCLQTSCLRNDPKTRLTFAEKNR